MKKVLLLLVALLCSAFVFAQQHKDHFEFNGISMGLPYEQFAQKLKTKGFVFREAWDAERYMKSYVFTGTFAGVKKCFIIVRTSINKKYIPAVIVRFPKGSLTQIQFEELKEAFVKKYGSEVECDEYGDNCAWDLDNGVILFERDNNTIMYVDKKNNERIEKDKEQRINNDI